MFVSRSHDLEAELKPLKEHINLREFVVPINNLLEPGKTEEATDALDKSMVERAGTKMGLLYQVAKVDVPLLHVPTQQAREQQLERRRQKEKTRPAHSPIFGIGPRQTDVQKPVTNAKPQLFSVSAATGDVFSALFDKSEARGSVS